MCKLPPLRMCGFWWIDGSYEHNLVLTLGVLGCAQPGKVLHNQYARYTTSRGFEVHHLPTLGKEQLIEASICGQSPAIWYWICGLLQVAEAVSSVLDGFLIGSGDVDYTSATTVLISGIGIIGIWLCFDAGILSVSILWCFVKFGNIGRLVFSIPRILLTNKSSSKSSTSA